MFVIIHKHSCDSMKTSGDRNLHLHYLPGGRLLSNIYLGLGFIFTTKLYKAKGERDGDLQGLYGYEMRARRDTRQS